MKTLTTPRNRKWIVLSILIMVSLACRTLNLNVGQTSVVNRPSSDCRQSVELIGADNNPQNPSAVISIDGVQTTITNGTKINLCGEEFAATIQNGKVAFDFDDEELVVDGQGGNQPAPANAASNDKPQPNPWPGPGEELTISQEEIKEFAPTCNIPLVDMGDTKATACKAVTTLVGVQLAVLPLAPLALVEPTPIGETVVGVVWTGAEVAKVIVIATVVTVAAGALLYDDVSAFIQQAESASKLAQFAAASYVVAAEATTLPATIPQGMPVDWPAMDELGEFVPEEWRHAIQSRDSVFIAMLIYEGVQYGRSKVIFSPEGMSLVYLADTGYGALAGVVFTAVLGIGDGGQSLVSRGNPVTIRLFENEQQAKRTSCGSWELYPAIGFDATWLAKPLGQGTCFENGNIFR